MSLKIQNSRQLLKRSTVSGATPTVFTGSTDFTDGSWGVDDIYGGELYLNMTDKKLWFGWETTGGTGVELIYPQAGTPGPSFTGGSGNCITDFYLTNMHGCSPITIWDNFIQKDGTSVNSEDTKLKITFDDSGDGVFKVLKTGDTANPNITEEYIQVGSTGVQIQTSTTGGTGFILCENTNFPSDDINLQFTSSLITGEESSLKVSPLFIELTTLNTTTNNEQNIVINENDFQSTFLQSDTLFFIDGSSGSTTASFDIRGEGTLQLTAAYNVTSTEILMQEAQIDINSLKTNFNGDVDINGNLSADTVSATTYFNTPFELVAAASDETTPITTGTTKVTFRMPCAVVLSSVRGSLTTAQTSGSTFTVDINSGGTSILSTKITIDNTENTSTTAATPPVLSSTLISDDAEITVDVDTVGNGTATGLKITLIGKRV